MLTLKKTAGRQINPVLQPETILLKDKGPIVRIGRSPQISDIVMDSSVSPLMISRNHAQIRCEGNIYTIECSGMNGILINSVKRSRHVLQNGDEVTFGGAGAETSEGVRIPNRNSELVYIFSVNPDVVANTESRDKKALRILKSGEDASNIDSETDSPSNMSAQEAGQVGGQAQQVEFDSDYSPGEGTSDGRVLRKRKMDASSSSSG